MNKYVQIWLNKVKLTGILEAVFSKASWTRNRGLQESSPGHSIAYIKYINTASSKPVINCIAHCTGVTVSSQTYYSL